MRFFHINNLNKSLVILELENKLGWNIIPLIVLYKISDFCVDQISKMATISGYCLTFVPNSLGFHFRY